MKPTKAILDGIRIIDTGQFLAGTGAGAILGCLGAETIKIEDPVRGDSYRGMTTQYGDKSSVRGRHVGFESANLNKRSMTLNLKCQKGREILYQLVARSDIFHTNATEQVREKLGMTYDILRSYNPKLIYAVTTTYGSRGKLSDRRGFDTIGQAYSGLMWAAGDQDYDEPVGITAAFLDQATTNTMAFAMVCALMARERLGVGQEIHVSIVGTGLHLQTMNVNMTLLRGRPWSRYRRKKSANPLTNNYKCADGKWIMLAEPQSQRYWAEACDLLGISQLKDDPRFATAQARASNCAELVKVLDGVFVGRPRDEWIIILEKSGTRMAYAPIYNLTEAVKAPVVVENEYVVDFNHPVLGPVKIAGFPVIFSETPAQIRREAPEHGQHTEEVLHEVLGYSWDHISRLREQSIV